MKCCLFRKQRKKFKKADIAKLQQHSHLLLWIFSRCFAINWAPENIFPQCWNLCSSSAIYGKRKTDENNMMWSENAPNWCSLWEIYWAFLESNWNSFSTGDANWWINEWMNESAWSPFSWCDLGEWAIASVAWTSPCLASVLRWFVFCIHLLRWTVEHAQFIYAIAPYTWSAYLNCFRNFGLELSSG